MKTYTKIITLLLLSVFSMQVEAQRIGDLNGINYQAVAIDDNGKEIVGMDIEGKPLYEKEIGVRFTIQKGESGEVQFQETHSVLTDQYGLFSLIIGHGDQTGSALYAALLDIPWIDADQWLKVEVSILNDGTYKIVSLQQFMTVPYSFYTDDIADDAITTQKILNEEILAEDINTGAVETSEILDETILAEDIKTGSVETSEILDETILAEDIATSAVETSEILDETILAEDIATGSVATAEILDETILAEDIATSAVESSEILDETILAEDIATGAVETSEILNGTIINEDIADGTIDLTAKVSNVLPVANGGTGLASIAADYILVGNGTSVMDTLAVSDSIMLFSNISGQAELYKLDAGLRTSLIIDELTKTITISAADQSGGPNSGLINFSTGGIAVGEQSLRNIPYAGVRLGDIILVTATTDLEGVTMTAYVSTDDKINVVFFNGTKSAKNLGGDLKIANFGQ